MVQRLAPPKRKTREQGAELDARIKKAAAGVLETDKNIQIQEFFIALGKKDLTDQAVLESIAEDLPNILQQFSELGDTHDHVCQSTRMLAFRVLCALHINVHETRQKVYAALPEIMHQGSCIGAGRSLLCFKSREEFFLLIARLCPVRGLPNLDLECIRTLLFDFDLMGSYMQKAGGLSKFDLTPLSKVMLVLLRTYTQLPQDAKELIGREAPKLLSVAKQLKGRQSEQIHSYELLVHLFSSSDSGKQSLLRFSDAIIQELVSFGANVDDDSQAVRSRLCNLLVRVVRAKGIDRLLFSRSQLEFLIRQSKHLKNGADAGNRECSSAIACIIEILATQESLLSTKDRQYLAGEASYFLSLINMEMYTSDLAANSCSLLDQLYSVGFAGNEIASAHDSLIMQLKRLDGTLDSETGYVRAALTSLVMEICDREDIVFINDPSFINSIFRHLNAFYRVIQDDKEGPEMELIGTILRAFLIQYPDASGRCKRMVDEKVGLILRVILEASSNPYVFSQGLAFVSEMYASRTSYEICSKVHEVFVPICQAYRGTFIRHRANSEDEEDVFSLVAGYNNFLSILSQGEKREGVFTESIAMDLASMYNFLSLLDKREGHLCTVDEDEFETAISDTIMHMAMCWSNQESSQKHILPLVSSIAARLPLVHAGEDTAALLYLLRSMYKMDENCRAAVFGSLHQIIAVLKHLDPNVEKAIQTRWYTFDLLRFVIRDFPESLPVIVGSYDTIQSQILHVGSEREEAEFGSLVVVSALQLLATIGKETVGLPKQVVVE